MTCKRVRTYSIVRTYPQFYHDLITMRGAMPTHLGRTHAVTLNTTPVPPWNNFIIIHH